MEQEKKSIKPVVYGLLVFITLGVAIANEMLSRFRLESNYMAVFSVAFVLAAVLFGRNVIMLALVLCGVVGLNLPDATLASFYLDRDVLLAAICAFILAPSVYSFFSK